MMMIGPTTLAGVQRSYDLVCLEHRRSSYELTRRPHKHVATTRLEQTIGSDINLLLSQNC